MKIFHIVVIVVLVFLGSFFIILSDKATKFLVTKEEYVATVDSVWSTGPGQENTLQTEYHYYGKLTNGQIIKSNSKAFQIGDSIQYIYYRYENTKKEKKH